MKSRTIMRRAILQHPFACRSSSGEQPVAVAPEYSALPRLARSGWSGVLRFRRIRQRIY
jgi:hypothetical protein